MWDPKQYHRYQDERARPFFDLLGRVGRYMDKPPALVADLGCGTGELTEALLDHWPESASMGRR